MFRLLFSTLKRIASIQNFYLDIHVFDSLMPLTSSQQDADIMTQALSLLSYMLFNANTRVQVTLTITCPANLPSSGDALLAPIYYSSPVSTHVLGLAVFLQLLLSFGIPFPWIFETVLPYPVFAANLKPSFTKQLFGLLSAPSHLSPAPQIRPVNRRHCALYKFIYLLNYLYAIQNSRLHKSQNSTSRLSYGLSVFNSCNAASFCRFYLLNQQRLYMLR